METDKKVGKIGFFEMLEMLVYRTRFGMVMLALMVAGLGGTLSYVNRGVIWVLYSDPSMGLSESETVAAELMLSVRVGEWWSEDACIVRISPKDEDVVFVQVGGRKGPEYRAFFVSHAGKKPRRGEMVAGKTICLVGAIPTYKVVPLEEVEKAVTHH